MEIPEIINIPSKLENVKEFKYLEVTFSKSNNFKSTQAQLKQATKAMYFVLAKSKDNEFY